METRMSAKSPNVTLKPPSFYSATEERLNILSHAFGFVASVVGLVLLCIKGVLDGTALHVLSFAIFGFSLVLLYGASTIYHGSTTPLMRVRLRTLDHAAIYVLIAGTYTPFTLLVLPDRLGWIIFGVVWGMAAVGIVLKLFYTGRFNLISTAMYVLMGWIIIFAIKPLIAAFAGPGLNWLIAGGIAYTLGAVFYAIEKMPFGHATFHLFVLMGSASHFIAVYCYIIQ
jgi:hemolysin III